MRLEHARADALSISTLLSSKTALLVSDSGVNRLKNTDHTDNTI
jgi:hypothetical protein